MMNAAMTNEELKKNHIPRLSFHSAFRISFRGGLKHEPFNSTQRLCALCGDLAVSGRDRVGGAE
jgi:hypothetical protein